MPQAVVGQRVQVDVEGLQAPGVSFGGGVSITGTIVAIRPVSQEIDIRLDVSLSGQSMVTAAPDRVSLIE